jgi:hypothetical protein
MKYSGVSTEWLEPIDRPEALIKFGNDPERTLEAVVIRSDLGTIETTITVRSVERRAGLVPVAIIRFARARWKRHLRLDAAPEKGAGYWTGSFSVMRGLLSSETITIEYALFRDSADNAEPRLVWREQLGTIKGEPGRPKIGERIPVRAVSFSAHHDELLNKDSKQPWRFLAVGDNFELFINTDDDYFRIHRVLSQGVVVVGQVEAAVARAMYAGMQTSTFTLYALTLALREISESGLAQLSDDSELKKYLAKIFGKQDYPTEPVKLAAALERMIRRKMHIDDDILLLANDLNRIQPNDFDAEDLEAANEMQT